MSGQILCFPNSTAISQYVSHSTSGLSQVSYYKEKGIVKAVSLLAADRFGNKTIPESSLSKEVGSLLNDLHEGAKQLGARIDGLSTPNSWAFLGMLVQQNLKACALLESKKRGMKEEIPSSISPFIRKNGLVLTAAAAAFALLAVGYSRFKNL